jgi:hypothetical protein
MDSYLRITPASAVKCPRESGGKKSGPKNSKIGNARLKWAFSEAACLFLRGNEQAQCYHDRLVSKHGKGKALSIIAIKLAGPSTSCSKERNLLIWIYSLLVHNGAGWVKPNA